MGWNFPYYGPAWNYAPPYYPYMPKPANNFINQSGQLNWCEEARKRGFPCNTPQPKPNVVPVRNETKKDDEWEKNMQKKWQEMIEWTSQRNIFVPPDVENLFKKIINTENAQNNPETKNLLDQLVKKWDEFKNKTESEKLAREMPFLQEPNFYQIFDQEFLLRWKYGLLEEIQKLINFGKSQGIDLEGELSQIKQKVMNGNQQELRDIEGVLINGWERLNNELKNKNAE